MTKMTVERIEKERIKLISMNNGKINFKIPSQRRQFLVYLSCLERYLNENINYDVYSKTFENVYKKWAELVDVTIKANEALMPNEEVQLDGVKEEWNKYELLVEKNGNDYLSPEALEQEWILRSFICKYYLGLNPIKRMFGIDKPVREIDLALNHIDFKRKNTLHKAADANKIIYYKVYFQNYSYEETKTEYYNDDFEHTYTVKREVIDDKIDFTGNTKDKYIWSSYVYAKKGENGIREIMTGKPLKKWPDKSKVTSMPEDYIYYETIEEVPESTVANDLAPFLNSTIDGMADEYISRLNAKQHDFIERNYGWSLENNLEELRRRKYEEEASKRSPNNVNKLRAYKPKTSKNK